LAEFAEASIRSALPPAPGRPREYDVPCERTFRRLLEKVDSEQIKKVLVGWMQAEEAVPLQVVHVDGKVVKNANGSPRSPVQRAEAASVEPSEFPPNCKSPRRTKP